MAKHSATAALSYAYLAYCTCTRKGGGTLSICAAFTDGDSDFLAVGRNGVFYDRKGQDWDATIVKVVEQPISIRQAFWAPYKRLVRFISDQAERFAASQDSAAQGRMTERAGAGVSAVQNSATTPAPAGGAAPASTGFDIGKFAGIFAAIGLAAGFLVGAVTMLVSGFLALKIWQMPIAIAGIMLLISGPSMLLAAFKLSRRNLAPLLDSSGWAINTRAKLNIPFGATLTQVAELPPGSTHQLSDPYRQKEPPIRLYIALVILACVAMFAWDKGLSDLADKGWRALTGQDDTAEPATDPDAVEAPAEDPATAPE